MSKGMLERLVTGIFVVYSVATKQKVCTVGKVLSISRPESNFTVHCHRAVCDCHLRMEWRPVYVENGVEVVDSSTEPLQEEVAINRILSAVQLQSGVLGHAIAI